MKMSLEEYRYQIEGALLLIGLPQEKVSSLMKEKESEIASSYGEGDTPSFAAMKITRGRFFSPN